MTEQSTDAMYECPEHFCAMELPGSTEMEAHLRWDHGMTDYRAEKTVQEIIKDER